MPQPCGQILRVRNRQESPIFFGQVSGGSAQQEFADISIHKLERVGNYAIRILFSDGHGSGIYSWDYLLGLEDQT